MVNSINMPVSRERMEKYQNRHMRQIEHASKQVEARESKTKNNNMRRVWMQRQNNSNYRKEYDRMFNVDNVKGSVHRLKNLGTWTFDSLTSGVDLPPQAEERRQQLLQ